MSTSISQSDFPVPIEDRYLEDYIPNSVYEYGSITISQQEILEFGRKFDPQPFHVDPEAARHGPFGGLIASGWHTASVMMRLFADHYLSRVASLGGPGVDELRWLDPVHPGDSLRIRVTVLEAKRSSSIPDRGLVRSLVEVFNLQSRRSFGHAADSHEHAPSEGRRFAWTTPPMLRRQPTSALEYERESEEVIEHE